MLSSSDPRHAHSTPKCMAGDSVRSASGPAYTPKRTADIGKLQLVDASPKSQLRLCQRPEFTSGRTNHSCLGQAHSDDTRASAKPAKKQCIGGTYASTPEWEMQDWCYDQSVWLGKNKNAIYGV